MIVWWMGALLADVYVGRIKVSFLFFVPLVALLILVPLKWIHWQGFTQHLWGLGFMGLFALLFYLQQKRIKLTVLHRLKSLGDISYSLYILHMPLLVFCSAALIHMNGRLPQHFWYIIPGILLGGVIGYLGYLVAEKPVLKKK